MKLIETDELPYINYKINASIGTSDVKEIYVAVYVKNEIIYTNSINSGSTIGNIYMGTAYISFELE